jgi:hypothetical protein
MSDEFPIDFTSAVGRVRKYIPDVVQLPDPADPNGPVSFMWSDEQIQSFVDDEWYDDVNEPSPAAIWRAAASVMIATANNENLILKKLVTEDLQTDGPAVAKAMLLAAEVLIKRAATVGAAAGDDEVFLIVNNPQPSSDLFHWGRALWR